MGIASESSSSPVAPNERAAIAADAVLDRHLRRMLGVPGTNMAVIAWPISGIIRSRVGMWHYWWHAHLVDLLVDAAIHRPPGERTFDPDVANTTNRLLRSIRLRNLGRWTNSYYDDMAWLGLSIERANRHLHLKREKPQRILAARMYDSWAPDDGGGIPWRTMDQFFNAPANGPASILLARNGQVDRAIEMADWMDRELIDPATNLVIDGIKPKGKGEFERITPIFTYCQGVVLGVETELARLTGDSVHIDRIERLLGAVEVHEAADGIIRGQGGGDGGLFMGVLARYLALIATDLPGTDPRIVDLRRRAAHIVTTSADAAWTNRIPSDKGPIFGADWREPATAPHVGGKKAQFVGGAVFSSEVPERDLSVQLSAWMVLEAAAAIELDLPEHPIR